MSEGPLLSAKDRTALLALQETYDTRILIHALLHEATGGCDCKVCRARYLRAMASRINPSGVPQLAIITDGMPRFIGPIPKETQ